MCDHLNERDGAAEYKVHTDRGWFLALSQEEVEQLEDGVRDWVT